MRNTILSLAVLCLVAATSNAFAPIFLSRPNSFVRLQAADKAEVEERVGELAADAAKWRTIKTMKPEDAEKELEGEWLEAYKGYQAQVQEDLTSIRELAKIVAKQVTVKAVKPKTNGQRKRDAWARKQARAGIAPAE